jgi:cobalt-zinc-cadmium efflux system outer membrane protein
MIRFWTISFVFLIGTQTLAIAKAPQHDAQVGITSLRDVIAEAERNSARIRAARLAWEAAKQMPSQVSTRPDPQFQFQQVNVGSPRPFAGYTNSDFAYVGLGVSQDLPYPGKLRLQGEIAQRGADVVQQQYESIVRSVVSELKSKYFQLGYLATTLGILQRDGDLLEQIEKAADAHYRSGMGNQQELLQAQLERTKLLREITMHHLEAAKVQADIKQLLNRPQSSADIEVDALPETTPLPYTFEELLAATKSQNPELSAANKMVEKQSLQVDLAHKDFYPDFSLQYMWQGTDPTQFRAYYMLSVGVRVPIYRKRKQNPELAQAELELARSRSDAEVQSEQLALQLRTEYEIAQKGAELLEIYRQGLVPQARAGYEAGLAAYQSGRQSFQPLIASALDVLRLDQEYWQNVADRETALARIEELTGLALREEGANK